MTEEEYFRKNYPDSCYGDRPLSPYWDFFQDGVEFGERQSEKKIEELEQELTVEKDLHQEETNLHLHAEEYTKSLEQQIEKMKRHCNCKHRDSEGYCEVKRTYLIDLSYDGCDKWELED